MEPFRSPDASFPQSFEAKMKRESLIHVSDSICTYFLDGSLNHQTEFRCCLIKICLVFVLGFWEGVSPPLEFYE